MSFLPSLSRHAVRVAGFSLGLFAATLPAHAVEVILTPAFQRVTDTGDLEILTRVDTDTLDDDANVRLGWQLHRAAGDGNNYAEASRTILAAGPSEILPDSPRARRRSIEIIDPLDLPETRAHMAQEAACAANLATFAAAFPEAGAGLQAILEECTYVDLDDLSLDLI